MPNPFKSLVNRRRHPTPRPPIGQLLAPRPTDRDYPAQGLTPTRLGAILRQADAGDLHAAMALFEEMEEKDAHLYAVASKRRLALTGLDWDIVSAAENDDRVNRNHADDTAAYCADTLAALDNFDDVLQHLALALGRNIAVAELVWQHRRNAVTLCDITPVDFDRILLDDLDRIRILTADQPDTGLLPPPHKFILYTPHNVSGHPARGGLLRVTALAFLGKNLALKDWLVFAEIFGMPVRIARYDGSVTPEEKNEVMRMLDQLGSNAAGMFSRAIELQFIEAGQGKAPPPFERLVDFLNREISKAWLGQTLTTETPGLGGSFGATRIHEEVRKDLRADDLRKEATCLRRDLLRPMTVLRFGPDAPVPHFRRRVDRPRSIEELTDVVSVAVNQLGLRVPRDWAHQALSIPRATDNEPAVPGQPRSHRSGESSPNGCPVSSGRGITNPPPSRCAQP